MSRPESPYTTFKKWVFSEIDELPDTVIKVVNPRSVMMMFCNHGTFTIFLNHLFNNYNLMKCEPIEFYTFLRNIISSSSCKIYKEQCTFIKSASADANFKELHSMFPELKSYEFQLLRNIISETDDNESFLEILGENSNPKMIKIKTASKKRGRPKKTAIKED